VTGTLPDGYEITGFNYDDTATSCLFPTTEMNSATAHDCIINIGPGPVDFTVIVDWMVSDDAPDGTGDGALLFIGCLDGSQTVVAAGPDDIMGPVTLPVMTPPTSCQVALSGAGSAVEVVGCEGEIDVEIGTPNSCTITATAFYEGIPTLSQYGLAIMALLMLGVGFVGFRRFV
jgi:hypothetical protein